MCGDGGRVKKKHAFCNGRLINRRGGLVAGSKKTVARLVEHEAVLVRSGGRHTRCLSDWSSDVCSSDLSTPGERLAGHERRGAESGLANLPYPVLDRKSVGEGKRVKGWSTPAHEGRQ